MSISERGTDFSARVYERRTPSTAVVGQASRLVARLTSADAHVVDVGCGNGDLLVHLPHHLRRTGIDPNLDMLARCGERTGAETLEGTAERLPLGDGTADAMVMRLSLHLSDAPAALAEARRVLAPDGSLTILTLDPEGFRENWMHGIVPGYLAGEQARFMTPAALEEELRRSGFVVEEKLEEVEHQELEKVRALEDLAARAFSNLRNLSDEELGESIDAAERSLPDRISSPLHWREIVASIS